jgi:hypothetical protein
VAKDFYAYLPVLMKGFYEGIGEDEGALKSILDGFLCSMGRAEISVLVDEIDRLLASVQDDQSLLEKLWMLGARDVPKGPLREVVGEVRAEAVSRLNAKTTH